MKQNYCSYTLGCRNYSRHFLPQCKGQCSKKMQGCIPITPSLPSASPPLPPFFFPVGEKKKTTQRKTRKTTQNCKLHQVLDVGGGIAGSGIQLGNRNLSLRLIWSFTIKQHRAPRWNSHEQKPHVCSFGRPWTRKPEADSLAQEKCIALIWKTSHW